MRLKFLLTVVILLTGYSAMAQFKWPEDPEKRKDAQEKWTMFSDSEKSGNYEAAKPHFEYLLANYPDVGESLYIKGIQIWDEAFESAKTDADKLKAADKVMSLYEKRFAVYPESKKENIARKANSAFRYYYKDSDKTKYLLDLFKVAYELEGNEAFYSLGRYYMNIAALAFARDIGITEDEILSIYDRCIEHIDYQISKAKAANKSTKSMEAVKDFVDDKLAQLNLIDCDFIIEKLVPEFKVDPQNAELAKKIFAQAFNGGCTDAEWFVDVSERVFEADPNYGVAYLLGSRFSQSKEYDKSKSYYRKAVDLTQDNTDKGKALKQIATIERLAGEKAEARKVAKEAAAIDPTLKEEMYTIIGDMILSSTECDQKQSQVQDRARFIVAYDYYLQGGNQLKANQAKSYFPSQGEIFTEGKELGDNVVVGCWIQEKVTLQKRLDQQ
ncbi:MAG: tetratricopeptide (TPR) repeat protein [Roseivirga sp.]|jgi:tetratricopeptide (TPR) repeat protein